MSNTPKAYSDTKVSVDKSRADIGALLRKRGASAIMWLDEPDHSVLRFRWTRADLAFVARFDIIPTEPDGKAIRSLVANSRKINRATDARDALLERDQKRLHRVLFWYLKSIFEAEDAGLLKAEEAILGWLEAPDGQRVADKIIPQLGAHGGDLGRVLQLPPGSDVR